MLYRPYWFDRISAGLDKQGRPVAWKNRYAGSSVIARWLPPGFKDGLDPDSTEGAIDLVYDFPNFHVEYSRVEPRAFRPGSGAASAPRTTSSWPRVSSTRWRLPQSRTRSPIAARCLANRRVRRRCSISPRKKPAGDSRCPRAAAAASSLQFVFGSYLAQVAEVEVSKDGNVRVRRVVCAMDCGAVVNPNTVEAQLQSGIIFGATAALYGEITLKDGRVEQTNFDTYQMIRMDEAPTIEVHVVKSSEPPGGMGETGTSGVVPAIANAIFAATGKRLRKMPVDANALKQPV